MIRESGLLFWATLYRLVVEESKSATFRMGTQPCMLPVKCI